MRNQDPLTQAETPSISLPAAIAWMRGPWSAFCFVVSQPNRAYSLLQQKSRATGFQAPCKGSEAQLKVRFRVSFLFQSKPCTTEVSASTRIVRATGSGYLVLRGPQALLSGALGGTLHDNPNTRRIRPASFSRKVAWCLQKACGYRNHAASQKRDVEPC